MITNKQNHKYKINQAHKIVREILNGANTSSINQKKELIKAINLYNESISILPTAEAYISLAYISLAYDDIKASSIYLLEALNIEPNNVKAKKMFLHIKDKYAVNDNLSESNKIVKNTENNNKISSIKSNVVNNLSKVTKNKTNDFFSLLNEAKKKNK
ncbi:MAG: hypothetical protein U0354_04550 [Candidatus Sericytochromatia bacterium]